MSVTDRIQKLEIAVAKLRKELDEFRGSALRGQPRQQNEASITPEETANQKTDSAQREIPLALQVNPSPAHRAQAQKPWYKTMDGWKLPLEFAGIGFGILYAVVTFYQWRDTNRNFRVDERAWIAPYQMCVEPILGISDPQTGCASVENGDLRIVFKVLYKNTGKTLAVNQQVVINPPSLDLDATVSPARKGPKTILAPEQISHVTLLPIDRSWFERVGQKPIYIRGKIWYDDIFGRHHWTEFCYVHIATNMQPGYGMCEKYNDCDDCNTNPPWWKFW